MKKKQKLRLALSREAVRDMMENKLRAKTIPSKKKYNRKRQPKDYS